MNGRYTRRRMRFLLLLLIATGPLVAQPEVYGLAGGVSVGDDEGSVGSGPAFAVGFGYRILKRLGTEIEYSYLRHERSITSGFLFKGKGQMLGLNLIYHFTTRRVQPFVLGGAGIFHYTNLNQPRSGPDSNSDFSFGWNGGAGVKARLSRHVYLRPEVRMIIGGGSVAHGSEPPFVSLRFGAGLGYEW